MTIQLIHNEGDSKCLTHFNDPLQHVDHKSSYDAKNDSTLVAEGKKSDSNVDNKNIEIHLRDAQEAEQWKAVRASVREELV